MSALGAPSSSAQAPMRRLGLPTCSPSILSAKAFPDGAQFRIGIPSVEGPKVLEAALESAASHDIVINRVSQGSGAMLLKEVELRDMAALGAEAGLEVSLFVGPREGFGVGAHARSEMASHNSASCAERGSSPTRPKTSFVLSTPESGAFSSRTMVFLRCS